MLASAGLVSEAQLREGRAHQRNRGIRIGEALVQLGHLDETTLTRFLAKQHGLPFVDLSKGAISETVLRRVPAELAVEQGLIPVKEKDGALIVAVDDQLKRIVADQLSFLLGCEVTVALAAPGALQSALRRHYGAKSAEDGVARAMKSEGPGDADAPIVRLVTRMFKEALEVRASDIHIEPKGSMVRVRYRVDGVLRTVAEHPPHLAAPLISRLKIMGSMDIAEKRKPQDGRIEFQLDARNIDVRVSILPSNHGETVVLRLLDRSANLISLRELGFEEDEYAAFRRLIAQPHGIVLVTGPTGSGKTTTLYGALAELNRPDVKILTAEDPVEYHIAGINQVQVNPKVGLSFARILKAMLRCAPNIILVGEIRDIETAEVAIQAALTGHLVFSTLHTNDAPSAITRLSDMGIAPFLVSSAVQGILAQRLVRRLCKECRESYAPLDAEARLLGLDPALLAGRTFARPRGCRACDGTGYRGRLGLFELFELDSDLRDAIFRSAPLETIRASALSSGRLRPLIASGTRKVLAGLTSVNEVLRVTRAAE
jgi:type IV pilus assembly protein PilB